MSIEVTKDVCAIKCIQVADFLFEIAGGWGGGRYVNFNTVDALLADSNNSGWEFEDAALRSREKILNATWD